MTGTHKIKTIQRIFQNGLKQLRHAYIRNAKTPTLKIVATVAGLTTLGTTYYIWSLKHPSLTQTPTTAQDTLITKQTFDQSIQEGKKWIIYKGMVADVSEFIDMHPGGAKMIEEFIGKELDVCWNLLPQHFDAQADELFQDMCIGKLEGWKNKLSDNPYWNSPTIPSGLTIHSTTPTNAESFSNEQKQPFIRNHLPPKILDPENYKLNIQFKKKTIQVSYKDILESKHQVEYEAAHSCAGNRRADMVDEMNKTMGSNAPLIKRTMWKGGAFTNITLKGTQLIPFLAETFNVNKEEIKGCQINVEGADIKPNGEGYSTSFTLTNEDTIFAHTLNGVSMTEPENYHYGFGIGRIFDPLAAGNRQIKAPIYIQLKPIHEIAIDPKWKNLDEETARTFTEKTDPQSYRHESPINHTITGATLRLPRNAYIRHTEYDEQGNLNITLNAYTNDPNGIQKLYLRINHEAWKSIPINYTQPKGKRYQGLITSVKVPKSNLKNIGENTIECYCCDEKNGCQPQQGKFNLAGVGYDGWSSKSC